MSTITTEQTLAEIIEARPEAIRTLEQLGLDYCCGGGRSLGDAAAGAGVDAAEVVRTIEALEPAPPAAWASMAPADLVDHIEQTHHAYLHTELARLDALSEKVLGVHGGHHPELATVHTTFGDLRDDLEPHLMKEEQVLFPAIRRLAARVREASAPEPATFTCGTLEMPISVMMAEHDRAGSLLERLHELTGGYRVPGDGCTSYRALYEGLAELEADTHLHVHKENNVLFPAVVALERGHVEPAVEDG